MKIIVVGAGKVGYSLAQRLIKDRHDVYVVEKSEDRIKNLENNLDANLVQGSGSDVNVLNTIGCSDVGMLIAVTDIDEVNMLACSVAKMMGVPQTIARVRNEEYGQIENDTIQEQLGVDLFINPERVTANEVMEIIQTPAALDVGEFANGAVKLVEVKVHKDHFLIGHRLMDAKLPENVLVVGILRNGHMIIPHGQTQIEQGDNVFFLGSSQGIKEIQETFHEVAVLAKRVLVIGAGLMGRHLTLMLEKAGYDVKVIDKDYDRCEKLAALVDDTMVIHGDATNMELLEAEEIGDCDIVVALTDDDKLNLLVALLGKHMGISKTFVRVGRPEYITLMEQVGIDVVFSPRLLTSGEIMRRVRSGDDLVSLSLFGGAKAEAVEVEITNRSPVAGKALKDIRIPGQALVGAVIRAEKSIGPSGMTELLPGDHIVIFSLPDFVTDVLDYLK